MKVHELQN